MKALHVEGDVPLFSVDLPSRGVFYAPTLRVRPLTVRQVRELYGALRLTGDLAVERAIVAALAPALPHDDIYLLTVPDYQFLFFWLRLNSYKRLPYTVRWTYTAVDGSERTATAVVANEHVKIIECNPHRPLDPRFAWPTVRDRLDTLAWEEEGQEALVYAASYAGYLKGTTLRDKVAALDAEPPDTLIAIREHQAAFYHGVESSVEVIDPDDPHQAKHTVPLHFSPVDFFP